MSGFPRVYHAQAAKATGKLAVARSAYAAARARGEHVHWVSNGDHTCRNGTPECLLWRYQLKEKK